MTERPNVFADEPWPHIAEAMGIKGRAVAKPAGARDLGATVYELEPVRPDSISTRTMRTRSSSSC